MIKSGHCESMRDSAQIRAARGLLGWSQVSLLAPPGVGLATIQRIEQSEGVAKGNFAKVLKIQNAVEQAGIHFTGDEAGEMASVCK